MYFLLSPAKSLNETSTIPIDITEQYTQPELIDFSCELMSVLKQQEPTDLMSLMNISNKIAQLNTQRNKNWQWAENTPFTTNSKNSPAKPAVYLFDGDVYTGLDVYNMNKKTIDYINNHVGILSGLYGLLRPLDLILPYRLEMGTKLINKKGNNLYEFWESNISNVINQRIEKESDVLVNLASNEYFKSVDKKTLKAKVITPRFEDEKQGKYKVISFYAKKARGLMVKYAADNQLTSAEQLKSFDLSGYSYYPEGSDDKTWTFRRDEQI